MAAFDVLCCLANRKEDVLYTGIGHAGYGAHLGTAAELRAHS